MLNFQIFAELITELENFYSKQLSDFAKKVYYKNLVRFQVDDRALKEAIEYAMSHHKFFPSPVELAEAESSKFLDVLALAEYQKIIKISTGAMAESSLFSLTPQCLLALDTLGGLKRFQNESFDRVYGNLQTEFVKRWLMHRNAIAAKVIEVPPAMLSEAKSEPEPEPHSEEYLPREDVKKIMTELKDIVKRKNNQNNPENS